LVRQEGRVIKPKLLPKFVLEFLAVVAAAELIVRLRLIVFSIVAVITGGV
jgi:hypothetical protein